MDRRRPSTHKSSRERPLPNTSSLVTPHKKDNGAGMKAVRPKKQTTVRKGRNARANAGADSSCGTKPRTQQPRPATGSKQRGRGSERKGKSVGPPAASRRQQTTSNKPARIQRKNSKPKPIPAREPEVPLEQVASERTLKESPGSPIELVQSMQPQPRADFEMWRSAVALRADRVSDTSRVLHELDVQYLEALLREGSFAEPRHVFGVFTTKADDESDYVYRKRIVRELEARMLFLEHTGEKESYISRHEWETAHASPLELSEEALTPCTLEWDYNYE